MASAVRLSKNISSQQLFGLFIAGSLFILFIVFQFSGSAIQGDDKTEKVQLAAKEEKNIIDWKNLDLLAKSIPPSVPQDGSLNKNSVMEDKNVQLKKIEVRKF